MRIPFFNNIEKAIRKKYPSNSKKKMSLLMDAIADPYFGGLNLKLFCAGVPQKYYHIFYEVKNNNICIDCGTNLGKISDILLHKNAIVHAFEPSEFLFEQLSDKYQNNPNISLYQKAVWDKNTTMPFYQHDNENNDMILTQSASFVRWDDDTNNSKEVDVIDICEFIQNLGENKIYLLKLDVEGAEFEILEKLIKTDLYKKIKYILCEVHPDLFEDGQAKLNLIKDMIEKNDIKNVFIDWI